MSEVTTHPAGFRVRDRRGEHAAPSTAVQAEREAIGAAEEVSRMLAEYPERYFPDKPMPSLAEVRRAKSILAGARGAHAEPLDADDRLHRYALQEICRSGVGVPGYRQPTARQQRRIRHKGNRAMRYLTSTAGAQ